MRQEAPSSPYDDVPAATTPLQRAPASPSRAVGGPAHGSPGQQQPEEPPAHDPAATARDPRRAWTGSYVRRIVVGDAVCALIAGMIGYLIRFGPVDAGHPGPDIVLTMLLPALWVFAMVAARSYEKRFLWLGPEEFQRIFFASALILATVGTVSWAFRLEVARGFIIVAIPVATALTLVQRYAQRKRIHRLHRAGRLLQTALLVGHPRGVAELHEQISREPYHGYRVIGCCLPSPWSTGEASSDGLPVLGGVDDVVDVVREFQVDTVAVLPSHELDGAACPCSTSNGPSSAACDA